MIDWFYERILKMEDEHFGVKPFYDKSTDTNVSLTARAGARICTPVSPRLFSGRSKCEISIFSPRIHCVMSKAELGPMYILVRLSVLLTHRVWQ